LTSGMEAPNPKRFRAGLSFVQLLRALHEDIAGAGGDPLNIAILRMTGDQAFAATCREALDWASLRGVRVILRLFSLKSPVPRLSRIATPFVESIFLGPDGQDVEHRAAVLAQCGNAVMLRDAFGTLDGLGVCLVAGNMPCLGLRQIRLRSTSIAPADFVRLIMCCPQLTGFDLNAENLRGLAQIIQELDPRAPELMVSDFTECALEVADVALVLRQFPTLRSVHLQGCDLSGLRIPPGVQLKSLAMVDCGLSRLDVVRIMGSCQFVEEIKFCGNNLGDTFIGSDDPWPSLPQLRVADFRCCGLVDEDAADLTAAIPHVLLSTWPVEGESSRPGRHVVFDDSDSDVEE